MLFIEWGLIGRVCLCLAVVAATVLVFWLARKRLLVPQALHGLLRSLTWPLAVFALLFVATNLLAMGCQTYTAPLYSPDHKMAVRVRSADEGWLGEWSHVELFRDHGLRHVLIFRGPWQSVDASSLRWINNSMLEIDYQDNVFRCGHAWGISVHCVARPEPPDE
jgi:hypothetical protein